MRIKTLKVLLVLTALLVSLSMVAFGAVNVEDGVLTIDADGAIFSKELAPWPERFTGAPRTGAITLDNRVTQNIGGGNCGYNYTINCHYGSNTYTCGSVLPSHSRTVGTSAKYLTNGEKYFLSTDNKLAGGIPWSFSILGEHYGSFNGSSITGNSADLSIRRYLSDSPSSIVVEVQLNPTTVSVPAVTSSSQSIGCNGGVWCGYESSGGNVCTTTVYCSGRSRIGTFPAVGGKSVTYYGVTAAQMAEREQYWEGTEYHTDFTEVVIKDAILDWIPAGSRITFEGEL